jgi:hypothetical protein
MIYFGVKGKLFCAGAFKNELLISSNSLLERRIQY